MLYVVIQEGSELRAKQEDKNNIRDLTVDVPYLVAHGESDEFIISVVHDKDLIHAEHLGGFHVSQRLVMLATLEADGLTPLICPGLSGATGQAHHVVPIGGRGNH